VIGELTTRSPPPTSQMFAPGRRSQHLFVHGAHVAGREADVRAGNGRQCRWLKTRQPAGGLVEYEQVRARHQGSDEQHFLLVALGVSPHLLDGSKSNRVTSSSRYAESTRPWIRPRKWIVSNPVSDGHRLAGDARAAGVPRRPAAGSRVRRSPPAPLSAGPAPGAGGSWWSSRRRSARDSRRPRRAPT
jgi:hypothetical protein